MIRQHDNMNYEVSPAIGKLPPVDCSVHLRLYIKLCLCCAMIKFSLLGIMGCEMHPRLQGADVIACRLHYKTSVLRTLLNEVKPVMFHAAESEGSR